MKDLLIDYLSQHIELNESEKAFLVSLDIFRSVKKGKTLLRAGDHSNVGYFVLKGCIRVYYLVDGEEKTTAFYTEMQGVTPTCVNTEQASDYTIDCVEDSLLLMSSPSLETETFAQFPKFESLCLRHTRNHRSFEAVFLRPKSFDNSYTFKTLTTLN